MYDFEPLTARTEQLLRDAASVGFPHARQMLADLDTLEEFTCDDEECQRIVLRGPDDPQQQQSVCDNVRVAHHDAPVRGHAINDVDCVYTVYISLTEDGRPVAIDIVRQEDVGAYFDPEQVTWERADTADSGGTLEPTKTVFVLYQPPRISEAFMFIGTDNEDSGRRLFKQAIGSSGFDRTAGMFLVRLDGLSDQLYALFLDEHEDAVRAKEQIRPHVVSHFALFRKRVLEAERYTHEDWIPEALSAHGPLPDHDGPETARERRLREIISGEF